jgi:hypothetical protein
MEFRMGADGWSEILYMAGSDPRAAGITSKALSLVRERLKILVTVGRIHHVRISPANEQSIRSYRFPVVNPAGAVAGLRDVGGVTITYGLYGGAGSFRVYKLHGCLDAAANYDANGDLSTAMNAGRQAYMAYLIAQEFEIRHRAVGAKDLANVGITDILQVAAPSLDVKFVMPTAGFAVNQKITVSGCRGVNVAQFNRNWTVKSIDAVAPVGLVCTPFKGISTPYNYIGGTGKVRSNTLGAAYTYQKIGAFDQFEGASTRKTGRPTDEHRGRVTGHR